MPSKVEWQAAEPFKLAAARQCKAERVREWLRIRCPGSDNIQLLGGSAEEVEFRSRWIAFPVRKGDRRVIQFIWQDLDEYGESSTPHMPTSRLNGVVSERWLADEAAPTIVGW